MNNSKINSHQYLIPKHYRLQWIKDGGGIVVSSQANIPITLGSYKKIILCHYTHGH